MSLLLQTNRFLREFSTFGIGGPIAYFAEISSPEEMAEAFSWAREKKLPFWVLGKGSNSLFPDRGFSGLVLLNAIAGCRWEGKSVRVGSGYSFSLLGIQSARKNLSGLEFASGIPASVGGAIFMNAGANGRETADTLSSLLYLHKDGEKREYLRSELSFGYRTSPFQKMEGAILEARFALTPSEAARPKQLSIVAYRIQTQPLKEKSIGCIFRNPEGTRGAGFLIDSCGLKGVFMGGAAVSEMHANFIVNCKGGSASDVRALIQHIQERVLEKKGIWLEPEIRIFDETSV